MTPRFRGQNSNFKIKAGNLTPKTHSPNVSRIKYKNTADNSNVKTNSFVQNKNSVSKNADKSPANKLKKPLNKVSS